MLPKWKCHQNAIVNKRQMSPNANVTKTQKLPKCKCQLNANANANFLLTMTRFVQTIKQISPKHKCHQHANIS